MNLDIDTPLQRTRRRRRRIFFTAVFGLSAVLTSCGSSGSNSEPSENDSEATTQTDQVESEASGAEGKGTITIGENAFTFSLKCAFNEDTLNEEVSISINGEGVEGTDPEIGMSFTQQWGIEPGATRTSPDAPVSHTITIYKDSGRTLLYEYLSLTRTPGVTKPLNVNGKVVSGSADFVDGQDSNPINPATTPGEVTLTCD